MPASALMLVEEAWNAYPYCKTVLTVSEAVPGLVPRKWLTLISLNCVSSLLSSLLKSPFLGEKFKFTVETRHYADNGQQENVPLPCRSCMCVHGIVVI